MSASDPGSILVEVGEDRSRLLLAFSGFQGKLMLQPYDFYAMSGLLGCSRILLRDPHSLCYLRGVGPEAPSFRALVALLRNRIAEMGPERVTCVGTSGGAFAALLVGHLLGVDTVHAFSPPAHVSLSAALLRRDRDQLKRRWRGLVRSFLLLPLSVRPLMNLQDVLMEWNGRTEHTIHFCQDHPWDPWHAEYYRRCPHVRLESHPCKTHQVAVFLARERKLAGLFLEDGEEAPAGVGEKGRSQAAGAVRPLPDGRTESPRGGSRRLNEADT